MGAFGLTLPNRGVLLGAITPTELLALGELADRPKTDRELTRVRGQIADVDGQLRSLSRQVAMGSITVSLSDA